MTLLKRILRYIRLRKAKSKREQAKKARVLAMRREINIDNFVDEIIVNTLHLEEFEYSDDKHIRHDLGGDGLDCVDIIKEIESKLDLHLQDGAFIFTGAELKKYLIKKIKDPDFVVLEDDLIIEETMMYWLGEILWFESNMAYSMAIDAVKQLIENCYQILPDGRENEFNDPINFTLKYFERYFNDKPIEAEELLQNKFPLMHPYIQRHIFKQQTVSTMYNYIDEENAYKAYNEFIVFYNSEAPRFF